MDMMHEKSFRAICNPEFTEVIESAKREIIGKYPKHPFLDISDKEQLEKIASHYMAMSQAFPYLLASAQKELIFHYIDANQPIEEAFEVTSVVGNFITWDETGGYSLVSDDDIDGLLKIFDTNKNFHSNLLESDFKKIFGRRISPDYGSPTKEYLHELYRGLASKDHVSRVASMFAFECHAHAMITALWSSLVKLYSPMRQKEFPYFYVHVSEEQGAEEYHVAMTNIMVQRVVPRHKFSEFTDFMEKSYRTSNNWCARLLELNAKLISNDRF